MTEQTSIHPDLAGSRAAIAAIRADRAALVELYDGLDAGDWSRPSGCAGWSVQDLLAHLTALWQMVAAPETLPATAAGLPTEAAQEAYVEARRDRTPAQALADYRELGDAALGAIEGIVTMVEADPAADGEMDLGDLGTYRLTELPASFAFDHFTHLRADLYAPRGPFTGPPPVDEERAGPAAAWIATAVAQQNPAVDLPGPLDVVVTGPGARTIRIGGDGPAAATITSDVEALCRWISQRGTWEDCGAVAEGDPATLEAARRLKVF